MWPWGHLAVGYLLATGWHRRQSGTPLGPTAAVLAGMAALLPDFVDKPLAWWVGVLPTGRSLAHSLLFGAVLLGGVWWVTSRRRRQTLGVVFAIGYCSHLAGDAIYPTIAGNVGELTFLFWPLVALPDPEIGTSVWAHVLAASPVRVGFELLLFGVAVAVWAREGYPGRAALEGVRPALRR